MGVKKFKFPHIGQRIIRSVCAVCICFIVYYLRGCRGIPFYSALAVLQCMQPYKESSIKVAKKRIKGTFVGAFWGTVVILLRLYVFHGTPEDSVWGYLMISLFTGVVLYTTVVLDIKNTAYFSCVVFLSITVMHMADESPIGFVGNRVLDTLIGIAVALVVNGVHLPRKKNIDTLFVSGLDDTLLTSRNQLTDYSKVELNRIIEEGAKFTVSTIQTPASVREMLAGVNLNIPIIAMDGAILYDMKENTFLMSYQMSYGQAKKVMGILDGEQVNYFTNVIIDDLLVIYYDELENKAEQGIYEQMKRSPYRNYVRRKLPEGEKVIYFMLIDEKENIQRLYMKLNKELSTGEYKVICYDSKDYPGYAYIKIYHKDATREHMLRNLMAILSLEKAVTFGSIEGKYDVFIEDSDKNVMVKKLKKRFEPVI